MSNNFVKNNGNPNPIIATNSVGGGGPTEVKAANGIGTSFIKLGNNRKITPVGSTKPLSPANGEDLPKKNLGTTAHSFFSNQPMVVTPSSV
jgi:hypothetical protein